MSLYGDYIKERLGRGIVENDKGFATYAKGSDGWYIEDIYVVPEYRKSGAASDFADKIAAEAKACGVNKLFGSVDPTTVGATSSLKVLLAYGFKVVSLQGPLIWFEKEI